MTFLVWHALLFALATGANLLSSMAGGGAGLVQLPVLIFLGLPFATAVATHKIATVALGVGASLRHLRHETLDWRFALLLLASGLPGVILGANSLLAIPEEIAQLALGVLTLGLAVYSLLHRALGQQYAPRNRDVQGLLIGAAGLLLLGVLNGSLTSGTGLFVTLWLVRWFGFDYKRATAYTLVMVGLFWNGTGAITLALLTGPQWSWLPALLAGSMLGGYWGASLAIRKGNPVIKKVFETVTALVGMSLILRTLL